LTPTHPIYLFFFRLFSEHDFSRNLRLNTSIPKNALFLLNSCKNFRALRALPPDSIASGSWRFCPGP